MPDHAHSDDPAVQAQLNRLTMLSPGRDVLGLERIAALMERLGNPHRSLPPVFHVAGTNGKGSTCAFLRATLEAAGKSVHVYSSPHLVRFNERIRMAGTLIDDATLAPLLAEVLDCSEDIHPSFFEATTAAAFLAFARVPADAAIIEVGLGGRLDATNIVERPLVCSIAQLAIDHQSFLGDTLVEIAGEKAGIAKAGVPLVTMNYAKPLAARVEAVATEACAEWLPQKRAWNVAAYQGRLHYRDRGGKLTAPMPRLAGAHQVMNAGLAIAMLRHQSAVDVPEAALKAAIGWAEWPARLQRLAPGPLIGDREVWLDGGHNPACAEAIATHFRKTLKAGQSLHLIIGVLAGKDASGIIRAFKGLATRLTALPVYDHPCHPPETLAEIGEQYAMTADIAADVAAALPASTADVILILGSLYLAGEVLKANGQAPD